MYINGLTQTCAALRCRIAELENDNRTLTTLRGTSKDLDPALQGPAVAAAAGTTLAGGYGGGTCGDGVRGMVGEDAIMQDMMAMALMSPPAGVVAERERRDGGGGARREGGFKGCGG